MKRQIFVLIAAVVLAMGTALLAQTNNGTGTTPLPPSQQVDPGGHPETGTGPDVDVDVGKNANNGVLNVDVKRHTDPDTKAQGDTPTTNTTGTTTTTGTTGTTTTTTDTTGTTGTTQYNNTTSTTTDTTTDTGMTRHTRHGLPRTGSEMPLFGLAGLLSLAGACVLRASR